MSALATPAATDVGFRLPRIRHIPSQGRRNAELGREAVHLVGEAGMVLDPWQEYVLQHSLRRHAGGQWAAREVGLCVPRQSGKGAILEARELVGLFIDERRWPDVVARLAIHSAHNADTAAEHFLRLTDLIEGAPSLKARLKKPGGIVHGAGGQGITLRNGRRIRFRTRTKGGGRGFSCDLLALDEAMTLPDAMHRAIFSTLSARPNPQIWYTGSAVDQDMEEEGVVFSRVRKRGLDGDPDLMWVEYSIAAENPDEVTEEVARDPEQWAIANPGLGLRISPGFVSVEQRTLGRRSFAVERLGAGDWPDPETAGRVIDPELWRAGADFGEIEDPVCLAFDVTPDRARACVAAAGWRADGYPQVEVIEQGRGSAWIGQLLADLTSRNRPLAIMVDARGAAGALLTKLEEDHGLRVADKGRPHGRIVPVTSSEMAKGCGLFFDSVVERRLKHLDDPKLNAAVQGASKRPLGDAWAWDKKKSGVDISPLVTATLALFGLHEYRARSSSLIDPNDLLGTDEDEVFEQDGLPMLEPEDLQ